MVATISRRCSPTVATVANNSPDGDSSISSTPGNLP